VELALKILDGSQIRGKTLSVQRAKFQMKGEYDPALKPKRKKKDRDRQKKMQEKWVSTNFASKPSQILSNAC